MRIETLATASLMPYARNSRTHSDAQVAQIAASIREFGFTNPVLIDADGGIIAGHGRVLAAQQLGQAEVPCIRLDHLSEMQKRAYIIADNKLALNAGWDEGMLALELRDLLAVGYDVGLTGYDLPEINKLVAGLDAAADTLPQLTAGFKFSVIVQCRGEAHQGELLKRFEQEGLTCRLLITQ